MSASRSLHSLTRSLLLLGLLFAVRNLPAAEATGYNTGMPFGRLEARDLSNLEVFAVAEGYDLMGDLNLIYEKNNEAALVRVFAFSLKLNQYDRNARAYGQLVYSSYLNLAARFGFENYAGLIASQPVGIRQRIRDYLFFNATLAPKEQRATVEAALRKNAPLLFPADYVFGAGDPVFKRR